MTSYRPVPPQVDLPALEHRVLELWEQEGTFEESLAQGAGRPRRTFYEGPPTANGRPAVKLSDNPQKATGDPAEVQRYLKFFGQEDHKEQKVLV